MYWHARLDRAPDHVFRSAGARDNAGQFQAAALLIRDGIVFSQSIDDFLDQHRTNNFVNRYGKAAIAKSILEAEQNCKLYFNPFKGQEMFDVSAIANT
jgi:hypothetical protein